MGTVRVKVQADGRGRILLPKDVRERLGVEPKAMLDVEQREDGSVVLRDLAEQRRTLIRAAKGSFRGRGGSVDELIAGRRAEAAREAADE